jgi:hypothetical protein
MRALRSPAATDCASLTAEAIGRVMERVMNRPIAAASRVAAAASAIIMILAPCACAAASAAKLRMPCTCDSMRSLNAAR